MTEEDVRERCEQCGALISSEALWLWDKDLGKRVPFCPECYESIKKCKMEEGVICDDCGVCEMDFM